MEEQAIEKPKYKTMIKTKSIPKKQSNNHLKRHSSHKSVILDSSLSTKVKRFESLININDDNIILNKSDVKHNATFTLNPKIKKKLLRDYTKDKKKERKYRKIKIRPNLIDSSQDSEESSEEDGDIGINFYISSESLFIFIFDCLLLFFSLFSVVFIPLNLAERKYFCKKEGPIYTSFQLITEILYIVDLIISFFRSYNYEYKKVTITNQIVKHYLKKGFFLDFISAFPSFSINSILCKNRYDYAVKYNLTLKEIIITGILIFKIFKILKVLNHQRNKFIELLYEKIDDNVILEQIINILIYYIKIFSFLHALICVHIFIGEQSFPNWMVHINIQNENMGTKYLSSFYFLIETMTTVGYGDIICISFMEIYFQIILLSIGIVSYSFIITKFGNYIRKKNKDEIELDEKKIQLEQIRIQYPLMKFNLYIKIQEFLVTKAYKRTNKKNEMQTLINNLPDQLRNELLLIINKDIINNFIIFKGCKNTDFIIKIISCFKPTICKKETILIKEGQQVDKIIFVKDGRLILEATIDLLNPIESYQKYFKENFQFLKDNSNKKESTISKNSSNNQEGNNNLEKLNKKLKHVIENLKLDERNSITYNIDNRNDMIFQMNFNNYTEENENSRRENKNEKERKFQYLKILDIRKNEHFGNICMFLEKPAPLSLIVKSKKAEIFFLEKKDATMINNFHHNIVKRIQDKSYKNLLSIKKKTLKVLKKYLDLSNYNQFDIQDKTWFNEKSKNTILQDITNFINISTMRNNNDNNRASINLNYLKTILRDTNLKSGISQAAFNYIDKKNTGNKSMNYMTSNWMPKKRSSIKMLKNSVISNINPNYIPQIILKKVSNMTNKTNNTFNIKTKTNKNNNSNKTKGQKGSVQTNTNTTTKLYIKKDIQNSQVKPSKFIINKNISNKNVSDQESLEITMEEEMLTLNNMKNNIDDKIRKKIKSSVRKDKILKLTKIQNCMVISFQEEIINSLIKDDNNKHLFNNFKQIIELNNELYKNLIEYLDTDYETNEEKKKIDFNNDKSQLICENNINFHIKASYFNLNNLTKGKIIKNENYKTDIKHSIKKFIKSKEKNYLDLINNFIKLYTRKNTSDEHIIVKNLTKKENNEIPHIDNFSLIFNNIINENTKNNKKKASQIPKHARTKKSSITTPKFISNQIKKTKTNNKDVYKNFKTIDNDGKSSYLKLNYKNNLKKNNNSKHTNYKSFNKEKDENEKEDSSNIISKLLNKFFSKLK